MPLREETGPSYTKSPPPCKLKLLIRALKATAFLDSPQPFAYSLVLKDD